VKDYLQQTTVSKISRRVRQAAQDQFEEVSGVKQTRTKVQKHNWAEWKRQYWTTKLADAVEAGKVPQGKWYSDELTPPMPPGWTGKE